MRKKRPRPASPDQVRIAREGETAVIEYADPSVRVVNLQVGPSLAGMLSLNRTVLALIEEGLGVWDGKARNNGLRRLAGTWTEEEFMRFDEAVAPSGKTDEGLWR